MSAKTKHAVFSSQRKGLKMSVLFFCSCNCLKPSTNSTFFLIFKGQPPVIDEEGRHTDAEQKGFLEEQKQVQRSETRAKTWQRREAYEQPGLHSQYEPRERCFQHDQPCYKPDNSHSDCVFKAFHDRHSRAPPWVVRAAHYLDSAESIIVSTCASFGIDKCFVKKETTKGKTPWEKRENEQRNTAFLERQADLVEQGNSRKKKRTSSVQLSRHLGII